MAISAGLLSCACCVFCLSCYFGYCGRSDKESEKRRRSTQNWDAVDVVLDLAKGNAVEFLHCFFVFFCRIRACIFGFKILISENYFKSGFFFLCPPSGTSATVAQGTSYIPMSVNFLVPLLVPLACAAVQHKAKVSVGKSFCL